MRTAKALQRGTQTVAASLERELQCVVLQRLQPAEVHLLGR